MISKHPHHRSAKYPQCIKTQLHNITIITLTCRKDTLIRLASTLIMIVLASTLTGRKDTLIRLASTLTRLASTLTLAEKTPHKIINHPQCMKTHPHRTFAVTLILTLISHHTNLHLQKWEMIDHDCC